MATKILPSSWLYTILEDLRREVHRISESDYAVTDAWVTNAACWLTLIPNDLQRFGWTGILADHFARHFQVPLSGAANLLQQRMTYQHRRG